jgi:hypothetical protein
VKFIYKIYSGYDGFTPRRIPDRLTEDNHLRLGWKLYLDAVAVGDEVWTYFHGPHHFANGVYVQATVTRILRDEMAVIVRVLEHATDQPLTDPETTARVATIAAPYGRQVFLLPEELLSTPTCTLATTAKSCAQRRCVECSAWNGLYRVEPSTVRRPARLGPNIKPFAPAYWVIPARCAFTNLRREIRQTTELFYRYKVGEEALAYPLALGIAEALRVRDTVAFDGIVPVPLSPDKREAGELDRAGRLAEELSELVGVPVQRLVSLSAPISKRALATTAYQFERQYRSLLGVDASQARALRSVLVVDDVSTHGSTIETIASALWEANRDLAIGTASAGQMVVTHAVRDVAAITKR